MSAMPPNNNPFLNAGTPAPAPVQPQAGPAASPPPPPAPAPVAPPAPPKVIHEKSSLSEVKDTVEAIIIALILALTFRAFMVEAFVIPTGSMAPTLLGAHYRVTCPKCGLDFDESADVSRQAKEVMEEVTDDMGKKHLEKHLKIFYMQNGTLESNTVLPAEDYRTCPNCGFHIHASQLPDRPPSSEFQRDTYPTVQGGTLPKRIMFFPWANNGDRILVMKYQYAIAEPKRWDVIVFKEPQEGITNYIKRLAGLPGETVEVIRGDFYAGVAPADGSKPVLHIQRKPDEVQKGMWQLVYDNDFYPIDAGKLREYEKAIGNTWENPWQAADADRASWDIHAPVIAYSGKNASTLTFHQRDFYLFNICGYNPQDFNHEPQDYDRYGLQLQDDPATGRLSNTTPNRSWHNFSGELHLETLWTPDAASAPAISMTLGLPYNCYRCGITADGHVTFDRVVGPQKFVPVPPGTAGLSFPATVSLVPGKPATVVMENVDHTIHFRVNGQELIHYEPEWTDAQAHKWVAQLGSDLAPPAVSIDVAGACTLGHLKLLRDVYYTNTAAGRYARGGDGSPVTLLADEFFALGDNSNFSSDSRFWGKIDPRLRDLPGFKEEGNLHAGRVPRRYLLGKAFFVYWPAGFRPMDNLPVPLVPDTGHMRIIR
jgi:signal peptidase I